MKLGALFVSALLLACSDSRGQLGHHCKPDGTCIGNLECVNAPIVLGLPTHDPYCRVKR